MVVTAVLARITTSFWLVWESIPRGGPADGLEPVRIERSGFTSRGELLGEVPSEESELVVVLTRSDVSGREVLAGEGTGVSAEAPANEGPKTSESGITGSSSALVEPSARVLSL